MSRPDKELSWVADGQARFEQTVMELDDLSGPSRLPGWTRGHVVTHVARNAEALSRLLTWARTGIETPMYPSAQARDADIQSGAARPLLTQLDDLSSTAAAFAATAQQLSADHWAATVGTRHGPVRASWIPWARVRELWLHLVDLDAGQSTADVQIDAMPVDIATGLVRDLADWMHTRVAGRIELHSPDSEPVSFGPGSAAPVLVSGSVQQLAGWLTGRCTGGQLHAPAGLPSLPPWL
ncbi:MAG: maleylpyruvate isomerase family mycothiol-dependent enzyme [Pseudonocardiales bacterium]|nr:maleylpyruvate isomerase family mycothiol-dependent enzyme [Pseudonocardiales bacterium]